MAWSSFHDRSVFICVSFCWITKNPFEYKLGIGCCSVAAHPLGYVRSWVGSLAPQSKAEECEGAEEGPVSATLFGNTGVFAFRNYLNVFFIHVSKMFLQISRATQGDRMAVHRCDSNAHHWHFFCLSEWKKDNISGAELEPWVWTITSWGPVVQL